MCKTEFDKQKNHDDLLRPLDPDSLNTVLWNDKCDYVNVETCTKLNPNKYNLVVLQHNIRSLLPNQTQLKQLMHTLKMKDSEVDLCLLCETFLSDKTNRLTHIPGYTVVENHHKNSKGGGVAILVKNGISFRRRQDLDVFKEKLIESVFIKILAKMANT